MELAIGALQAGDNCTFFENQRNYEASMMKRIDMVLFAIVITVAVSLIGLIISIAVKEWGTTAATGIGTVVSGTAMKFILDQKKDHQERIDKWVEAITSAGCP
jgi:hypothetical protein